MNSDDKQRMESVERWANYVINNKDWSRQQKMFIDAQIRNARAVGLTKEQVEYIKEGQRSPRLHRENAEKDAPSINP